MSQTDSGPSSNDAFRGDELKHSSVFQLWRGLAHNVRTYLLRQDELVADLPWMPASLRVDARDVHGRYLFKRGVHETSATLLLMRYFRAAKQDVVLDVGGNIGYFSLLAHRCCPADTSIHVFEAEPDNRALLEDNLRRNRADAVKVHQVAVADQEGTATLYLYKQSNRGKHSLVPIGDGASVEVRTTTLDRVWEEQGLGDRVPSLLKMDIEGGEYPALCGARSILARCPMVMIEWAPKFLRRGGISVAAFVELIREAGLTPAAICEDGRLQLVDFAALESAEKSRNVALVRDDQANAAWLRQLRA